MRDAEVKIKMNKHYDVRSIWSWLCVGFVALGTMLLSSVALAISMEDIEFSSLPGDKIEIRMIFDGTPPEPTGYTIEQPARIALDLAGVTA